MPALNPIDDAREQAQPALQDWKLTLSYDGTDFCGWQVQPGKPTIQGTLAAALQSITGEELLPQGSGRTDAGVHAEGQVVSLALRTKIPAENLQRALNRILPSSIRVVSAEHVQTGFHARGSVLAKTYAYRIFLRHPDSSQREQVCAPQLARYVWDCPLRLALEEMQKVADAVLGEHDFTSFAASDPDRSARMASGGEHTPHNVRTIYASEWKREDNVLLYRVRGSGFLHHMVRNLVGTFVLAGMGRLDTQAMEQVLAGRDRSLAGPTAPPQGLSLVSVEYAENQR